jgi:hypothetical protein
MLVLLNLKRLQTLHSKLIPVSTSGCVSNTTPRSVVHLAQSALQKKAVREFRAITSASEKVAEQLLTRARWNLEAAVDIFYTVRVRRLADSVHGFQIKQQRRHQTDTMSISPFVCWCCVLFVQFQGGGLASVSRGAALKLGDEARLNDLFNKYAGTARAARASVLFPRIHTVLTDSS